MAKNVKKAKPVVKSALKSPPKPVKKQAKAAVAPAKKAVAKSVPLKPVAKAAVKMDEKPAEKPVQKSKEKVVKLKKTGVTSKVKSPKTDGKGKKPKSEDEFEDDLMVLDEDMGAEEIPDLSEFFEVFLIVIMIALDKLQFFFSISRNII